MDIKQWDKVNCPLDDSDCFTVAQIDQLMKDNSLVCHCDGLDNESFRNHLINRMTNRILYTTGQQHMMKFPSKEDRIIFLRDIAYKHFITTCETLHGEDYIDERYDDSREGFRVLLNYLTQVDNPLHNLKFIFCGFSIEAKFDVGDSTVSFEYFYDDKHKVFPTFINGINYIASEASNPQDAWKFVKKWSKVNMNKEEFTEKVKKALEEGVYPDEDGRPSKLSEEDIDDMLETYNYIIDAMLERRQEFLTEENLVQATADRIWTADAC